MEYIEHVSVMPNEVNSYLTETLPDRAVVVDATLGGGGHSLQLLKILQRKRGFLVAIDIDENAVQNAEQKLADYKKNVRFVVGNFASIHTILHDIGIEKIDGLLLDLGVSSMHFADSMRGFSFAASGPLDMRLGSSISRTAADIVNSYDLEELYTIIRKYGEERWARRIARRIIDARQTEPITTTDRLVEIILSSIPARFHRQSRIHPATRTFQALRIEVNQELDSLQAVLDQIPHILKPGGRVVIISFHSLEDRLVKHAFRELHKKGDFTVLTKKPLVPSEDEIRTNPRARSAKMRVIEKL